jgi:hypothetical protein
MVTARHFSIGSLRGNTHGTPEAATAQNGAVYAPESDAQLVPTEAMVKREQRFGQATRDQEFPAPEVGENGSKIRTRGFADAMDRVGRRGFARRVKSVFRCRRCPVTLFNKRRLCLRG